MEIYNANSRFISILSDYGFKVTFGNEEDTTFLKKALQALIDSPIPIKTIEFIKNEMNAITIDSRSGIYDIACIDEYNNHFVVEMQLSDYPEFIQRMKFYALHRFNTMVKKGAYKFEDLSKIYCIGILAVNIFPSIKQFHNIAVLRNDKNEIIDDQMTFITIELAKFTKPIADIQTDLEKLIYTMKTLHTVTETSQFPAFWDEEWLKKAIHEVDLRAMTAEQKLAFEMAISANALAVKNENKKIEEIRLVDKIETVTNGLNMGLTFEQCSILANVSLDFVKNIQEKLNKEK
ncbi:Rpn family recombination-promoting nuclease/putative transposase [Arcicella sp. DC2W]|uniref:Rpn family recombination-promoting nuclease/putative transposase n=1 Tax=Arcicella gelida TaxID=2984195 RepID=A0ABU5RYU3_9BACT|nr:Rpn family recombination-promoting nuclease/putative transposase [Arcicella sp. DC2W]MEA5401364.1 Rpn family recombination-promoting nuclease/putative transposase [Arcicella sp. DC2W]